MNEEILLIIDEEIQAAINKLKKGKASDNTGIRAEDINTCDNVTKETIKRIFNEVSKTRKLYSRNMAQKTKKLSTKKGSKKMLKLSPNLYFASTVQTGFDCLVQQTVSQP